MGLFDAIYAVEGYAVEGTSIGATHLRCSIFR